MFRQTRALTHAIAEDRLDFRADDQSVEGTWTQMLAEMNDGMAAFEDSQSRRRQAEGQLEDFFDLSPDLLCIAGDDGYYKRVSRAFEGTLGYSTEELLSRPFVEFIHPDDRARLVHNPGLVAGKDISHFEIRYLRADGSECWLEWSARAAPEEGLLYAVGRDVTDILRVRDEQSALRRVATLAATATPPSAIFDSVAEEIGHVLAVGTSAVWRYHADGSGEIVAQWCQTGEGLPVGLRVPHVPGSLTGTIRETKRPARVDRYNDRTGRYAREIGINSAVGVPIVVDGDLWGVVAVVSTSMEPPPPETEERLTGFTELVATAIASAQAREELRMIAEEQAALGRVATLVAEGQPSAVVFAAVAEQIGHLLVADDAMVCRFEPDETVSIVASWAATGEPFPVGFRRNVAPGEGVTPMVRDTGRPARIDTQTRYYEELGVESVVAAPITVQGRLWGLIALASRGRHSAPPDTEERLAAFTDLVATAIANADSRAQLLASRERIVAAGDEARRRIERDLHDGAQQRLVSLALQLRKAQAAMPRDVAAQLDDFADGLGEALVELGELARGIHPPILSESGLGPALKALGRRSAIPAVVVLRMNGRLPDPIEIAAYFIVSEALTNAIKHAQATAITITVEVETKAEQHVLRITVQDDGVGGATFAGGSGLVGLRDRAEALGGSIFVSSMEGVSTTVHAEFPLPPGYPVGTGT